MRYGTAITAAILTTLIVAAPLAAGAADEKAQTAASDVAKGIEGVKSVKNDLQVVTPAARQAVDANDKDIAKAVETRLAKDLQLKKVDVRTDAGVVTLTGQVATIDASAKASEMARGVDGVKSVKNELAFAK